MFKGGTAEWQNGGKVEKAKAKAKEAKEVKEAKEAEKAQGLFSN